MNMIIESIEKNENIPSMARIYMDNKISFCLPQKRIDLLNLTEGRIISEDTLDYILNTEVYAAAKSAAVKFLALKMRSSYEISRKLSELGYEQSTIDRVIENLTEIEYIDDYKYAVKFISEKTKLKPGSIKLLTIELNHKGISDDIIEKALEEFELDEDDVAYELLKKRYFRYTSFDEKTIHKMKSFLQSKGFSYTQISKAISRFLPDD